MIGALGMAWAIGTLIVVVFLLGRQEVLFWIQRKEAEREKAEHEKAAADQPPS